MAFNYEQVPGLQSEALNITTRYTYFCDFAEIEFPSLDICNSKIGYFLAELVAFLVDSQAICHVSEL